MFFRVLLSSVLLMMSSFAMAATASATDALGSLLDSFQGLTARFQQTTYGTQHRVLQQASGEMAISRPDKFRWNTLMPNKQLIIMDGKSIWVYDVDLEQASVRPITKNQGQTPAMLLSGSTQQIQKYYRIQWAKPAESHIMAFTLTPIQKDGLFRSLTMTFQDQSLTSMVFHDNLGQLINISFTQVIKNPRIAAKQFQFKPPKGIDVIGANT